MRDSQINPYEHSEIKVRLLKEYLERYASILALGKNIIEVDVYDVFCGEGLYENGKEGSPVIILKLIKDIYFRNKAQGSSNVKFNCYFNDKNHDKTFKLKNHIANEKIHYPEMGSLTFLNEDYEVLKHKIVSNRKRNGFKSFVFIDPYGYKDISISDIENFLSGQNTEVLLFLPTQFMYRFEKEATPTSLHKFLTETFTEDELRKSNSGIDFIQKLRDGFAKKLEGKHYVDSFIITRDSSQYFALFFFTSHLYGFEKFLEAKWKIDEEDGRGWSPSVVGQASMFSLLEAKPNTDKFERSLVSFLKEKRTNVDIHKFTIENRHLITHSVQILKKLQNSEHLSVELYDGTKARKGSFYLSWPDVKNKVAKCFIKYK